MRYDGIYIPYKDKIGLCHSIVISQESYVIRNKCHVRWLRFNFKRMLITGLGQKSLNLSAVISLAYMGKGEKEKSVNIVHQTF